MDAYLLFVAIASVSVLIPGPGVIHTLSNSIRYGATRSIAGILGIAIATFVVAAVAATGLGLILATSTLAFTVLKYVGAAYLIYLGVKQWRAPPVRIHKVQIEIRGFRTKFFEGALIQTLNPKAILFFMSIFPQFIDQSVGYIHQFAILVSTYSLLVVVIHLLYAMVTDAARNWFVSPARGKVINRISGVVFVGFGVGMATSER